MRALVVIAAVSVGVGAPSHASADETAERAKREFKEGVLAAERGDYEAARSWYQRSYDHLPHPRTIFNLAAVAEHLSKDVEAYEAYKTFVATASDREQDLLPVAQRKVAELGLKLQATLDLASKPARALVFVDEGTRALGQTPLKLRLVPGKHVLRLELKGHGTKRETISVEPRSSQSRLIDLATGPAHVRIQSNFDGPVLTIDDRPLDGVRLTRGEPRTYEVVPGQHRIAVRTAGMPTLSSSVELRPGAGVVVDVRLGERRSTTNKLVLGSMFGVGLGLTAIAGYYGLRALSLEQTDGRAANDAKAKADVLGVGGMVLTGGAIVGFVVTWPPRSVLDVRPAAIR